MWPLLDVRKVWKSSAWLSGHIPAAALRDGREARALPGQRHLTQVLRGRGSRCTSQGALHRGKMLNAYALIPVHASPGLSLS